MVTDNASSGKVVKHKKSALVPPIIFAPSIITRGICPFKDVEDFSFLGSRRLLTKFGLDISDFYRSRKPLLFPAKGFAICLTRFSWIVMTWGRHLAWDELRSAESLTRNESECLSGFAACPLPLQFRLPRPLCC
jgi:hypothetical protein